ncbi:MAG: RDD family protein, partial [Actinobacteria bacterium]|nr:RDD family protein [Actinomycetota bacterium]
MSYLHTTPSEPTPTAPPGGPPMISRDDLASPWRRIGATLLDGLIWSIPLAIGFFLAFESDPETGGIELTYPIWWWTVAYLFGFLYGVVPVALWGQTLGKHLVKV